MGFNSGFKRLSAAAADQSVQRLGYGLQGPGFDSSFLYQSVHTERNGFLFPPVFKVGSLPWCGAEVKE